MQGREYTASRVCSQVNPPHKLSTLESGTPIGGPSLLKLTIYVKVDFGQISWLAVEYLALGFPEQQARGVLEPRFRAT